MQEGTVFFGMHAGKQRKLPSACTQVTTETVLGCRPKVSLGIEKKRRKKKKKKEAGLHTRNPWMLSFAAPREPLETLFGTHEREPGLRTEKHRNFPWQVYRESLPLFLSQHTHGTIGFNNLGLQRGKHWTLCLGSTQRTTKSLLVSSIGKHWKLYSDSSKDPLKHWTLLWATCREPLKTALGQCTHVEVGRPALEWHFSISAACRLKCWRNLGRLSEEMQQYRKPSSSSSSSSSSRGTCWHCNLGKLGIQRLQGSC